MAFVTSADLATFMGDPSLSGSPQADMAVSLASAIVSDYIGNPGLEVATEHAGVILDGPARGSSVFLLPGYPVSAVSLVETLDSGGVWTLEDPTSYGWNAAGFVSRNRTADSRSFLYGCYWTPYTRSIRVTYTSGFVTIPESVRAVTLAIAARGTLNPIGVLSEQVGDYQVGYGAAHSSWLQLDPEEIGVLSRYTDWAIG